MEFVRGETLETIAERRMGALTPEQAVFVIDRVLSALAHTHRAGIVHCDIKPSNIMVGGARRREDHGFRHRKGAGMRSAPPRTPT